MSPAFTAVVLAAGLGTRMKSARPKVLHEIGGRPLIGHVVATLAAMRPSRIVLVIGPEMDEVTAAAHAAAADVPITAVVQHERKGTAHAVLAAKDVLAAVREDVVIAFGDTPLVRPETLERLLAARRGTDGRSRAVAVIGMRPADPGPYGRLVTGADGTLERIVEAKDASPAEAAITLCNAGVMAVDGTRLLDLLAKVRPDNTKGEFYLTDLVALARTDGLECGYIEAPADELIGINSRAELAAAETLFQTRARNAAMANGATLIDPATVWFSYDTRLGQDVTVGPMVVFGPGVEVRDGVVIRGFCHIEGAVIETGAIVGPFARLRPGAVIGPDVHIGNFVEIKAARVERGAKINHLAYVGDARVGARANVGAGTVTVNYDGFTKSFTDIGAGAFIGSNSSLVAPVTVGDGAIVAAGSVITADVAPDAIAFGRARQVEKPGRAKAFRDAKAVEKAKKVRDGRKD